MRVAKDIHAIRLDRLNAIIAVDSRNDKKNHTKTTTTITIARAARKRYENSNMMCVCMIFTLLHSTGSFI